MNGVMNEILIWINKYICIDKTSVYSHLFNLGIIKVGDRITDNNLFFLPSIGLENNY